MTDVETSPSSWALVAALARSETRDDAFQALLALGPAGLGDGRWEVRRWCLYWCFRFAEAADLDAVVPLVRDPRSRVRHAALVVLTHAPAAADRADVVPLLLERACADESLRVRRQAVVMLAWTRPHPDLAGFFRGLLDTETDPKLRKWAQAGLERSC